MSDTTYRLLAGEELEYTGGVDVKGKGRMDTFLWTKALPGPVKSKRREPYLYTI